eukprot:2926339-Pyramimonas_sp.AAC.1
MCPWCPAQTGTRCSPGEARVWASATAAAAEWPLGSRPPSHMARVDASTPHTAPSRALAQAGRSWGAVAL